jgi:hypothetical protein
MLIKGNKKDSMLIRWLQKMASSDAGRPVLTGLNVDNGQTVACNGFRMVVIDTPEFLQDAEGKIVRSRVSAGEFESELEEIDGTYPDYQGIYPKKEAQAIISVNPKLLREMLSGLSELPVSLVVYGDTLPMELYGKTRDERDAYMILMPMHRGYGAESHCETRPDGSKAEVTDAHKRIKKLEDMIESQAASYTRTITDLQKQLQEREEAS